MVLEYTLRKHASSPLTIVWMKLSRDPASPFFGWNTSQWATPFSGFRWAVPELCGFKGRAIYMDSDMICRADIADLFTLPMHPKSVALARGSGRLCVTVWDCAMAERVGVLPIERLKSDAGAHHYMSVVITGYGVQQFPIKQNWNCLDGEKYRSLDDPEIKMLHYTSMPHQPHLPRAIVRLHKAGLKHWFDGKITPHWRTDLQLLFDTLFYEAQDAGYTIEQYCNDPVYGEFAKASVGALQGTVPHWGR